ncbi:hypothetical protein CF319_g8803, partial [Tilletia indica]
RDQYGATSPHAHAHFWGNILHGKILSRHDNDAAEGPKTKRPKDKVKEPVSSDVQKTYPGPTVIQQTMKAALARVYTVHSSAHWHRVRVILHALEMSCQQGGITTCPAELKAPQVPQAIGDTPQVPHEINLEDILVGYFGEYRTAVPMVNSTTGGRRDGPLGGGRKGARKISTFRLRDRPLLAAFLPGLVPIDKVPFDHRLRVMDATVLRLWEPQADEHQAVLGVHTPGRISILSPSVTARVAKRDTSGFVKGQPKGPPLGEVLSEPDALQLAPEAIQMPPARAAWFRDTLTALGYEASEEESSTCLVTNDLLGDDRLSDHMSLESSVGLFEHLFSQDGLKGSVPHPGLSEEMVKALRLIPNHLKASLESPELVKLRSGMGLKEGDQQAASFSVQLEPKWMIWECLGPTWDEPTLPFVWADQRNRPHLPLLTEEYLRASAGVSPIRGHLTAMRAAAVMDQQAQNYNKADSGTEGNPELDADGKLRALMLEKLLDTVAGFSARHVNTPAPDGPVPGPSRGDLQRFPHARSHLSADLARLLEPSIKTALAGAAAVHAAEDIAAEEEEEMTPERTAIMRFFAPLFEPSNWESPGEDRWPGAYRNFCGFSNPYTFTPAVELHDVPCVPSITSADWKVDGLPRLYRALQKPEADLQGLKEGVIELSLHPYKVLEDELGQKRGMGEHPVMSVGHMYDGIITAEPTAAPWYPEAGNVYKSEYRTLGMVWKGGDQLLSPQPLVYAWGQSYDLSPAWAEAIWYQPTDENFPHSGTLGRNNPNESVTNPWSLASLNVPKRVKELRDTFSAPAATPSVPLYPLWMGLLRLGTGIVKDDLRYEQMCSWARGFQSGKTAEELVAEGRKPPPEVTEIDEEEVVKILIPMARTAGGHVGQTTFHPDYAWKTFISNRKGDLYDLFEDLSDRYGEPSYLSDRDGYPVSGVEQPEKVVDSEEEDLRVKKKVRRLQQKVDLDDFVVEDEPEAEPHAPYDPEEEEEDEGPPEPLEKMPKRSKAKGTAPPAKKKAKTAPVPSAKGGPSRPREAQPAGPVSKGGRTGKKRTRDAEEEEEEEEEEEGSAEAIEVEDDEEDEADVEDEEEEVPVKPPVAKKRATAGKGKGKQTAPAKQSKGKGKAKDA